MNPIAAITIFCEDIREEKAGTDTVIGIFTDNIEVPQVGGIFPKICAYTRINVDHASNLGDLRLKIFGIDGSQILDAQMDPALIDKARSDSLTDGNPITSLVFKTVMSNVAVFQAGRISAVVTSALGDIQSGSLNIKVA